jgi:prepilin-type N-terminal cleavage/methylation domain-containing protein/prepilin-type processing-associated H-X9-DG protein
MNETALRKGFSLVELLVVAAILSVLAAVLVPSLQKARQTAQTVECAGRLRSWGVSFQLYSCENGGFYPLSWINNSDHWLAFMAPYVNDAWMSYDPSTFAKRIDRSKCGCPGYLKFNHPDSAFRPFPYAYNAARFDYPYANLGRRIKGTPEKPEGWGGYPGFPAPSDSWDVYGIAHRYNGMSNVERVVNVPPAVLYTKPGQCVTLFCGVASTWCYLSFPWAGWLSMGGGSDWDVITGDGLVTDGNGVSAYGYNAAPAGIHSHRGKDWHWHSGIGAWILVPKGRDNYLFMDGHVETLDNLEAAKISRYVYNQIPNANNPYK